MAVVALFSTACLVPAHVQECVYGKAGQPGGRAGMGHRSATQCLECWGWKPVIRQCEGDAELGACGPSGEVGVGLLYVRQSARLGGYGVTEGLPS